VREAETLRLARSRILQQIEGSRDPRHRKMLEDALKELERKIADLGGK
jgi:hypothetical protein